jgi:hypothetical protein
LHINAHAGVQSVSNASYSRRNSVRVGSGCSLVGGLPMATVVALRLRL